MRKNTIPDLTDIVSEGRNKDYGYYRIRKKYSRTLFFSFLAAFVIFLSLVVFPLLYFHLWEDDMPGELYDLTMAEYTFIPPPEDMPLVPPGPPPEPAPQEAVKPPVVVKDSVPEQEPVEEEEVPEESRSDTSGNGNSAGPGSEGSNGEGIFTSLDVYPRFPGGDQARLSFLRFNIRYPQTARHANIQGVVKVVFVVEPDGSLSRFEITKGIGHGCDEEALRVARMMPRWEPARRNGKTVRALISMPIVFALPAKPK